MLRGGDAMQLIALMVCGLAILWYHCFVIEIGPDS